MVISPHCPPWGGKDDMPGPRAACTCLKPCLVAPWLILSQPVKTSASPAPSFNPAPPGPGRSSTEVFSVAGAVSILTSLSPLRALSDCGFSAHNPALKSDVPRTDSAEVLGTAPRHVPPAGHSSSLAFAAAKIARERVRHSCTCLKIQPGRRSSMLQSQITLNS